MVAAPIQKLWPEYLDASTPDDPSAVVILLTNAVLDSGAPLANLKNGPGSLPHTANKIGNSPAHVGYDVRDCASSYPPPPRQTQEVVVGWVVYWRVSMLTTLVERLPNFPVVGPGI